MVTQNSTALCSYRRWKFFAYDLLFFQVCFEITTSLTIDKVVTNRARYYKSIDALPEWTKPELTETVPAFTIWIDESQSLRKYEFQCAKSDEYVPLPGFIMKDVR